MAVVQITKELDIINYISYVNNSFCLYETNDHITENDKVFALWVNEKKDERTIMIHLKPENQEPLVGIFFEWRKLENGSYGCDRMMWVGAEMAQMLQKLNITQANTLFAPKK